MADKSNTTKKERSEVSENAMAATGPNCGIILTIDGSFKAFTHGMDPARLQRPEEELSAEELAMVDMARKLTALVVALSNEAIMEVLYDLAENTDILKLRPET